MRTLKLITLAVIFTMITACSTDSVEEIEIKTVEETVGAQSGDNASNNGGKNHGGTAILITWENGTTDREKNTIRNQYSLLFTSWYVCNSPNKEIWVDYCENCQPFQNPEDDHDSKISSISHHLDECSEK